MAGTGAAAEPQSDLITMRNGDIHNGRVAERLFRMETLLGSFSVPAALTRKVEFSGGGRQARLTTRFGERFVGSFADQQLTVTRVLDTLLPVQSSEIAEIVIASRRSRQPRQPTPDTFESYAGDLFSGRVATTDFFLRHAGGVRLIKRAEIHLLDTNLSDADGLRVRLLLNDGSELQGVMPSHRISLIDRYGNRSEADIALFSRIAFNVNFDARAPSENYRMRVAASDRLQERLRDGSPGPEMVVLRGGAFERGDLQGDGDSDERNPQRIALKPFAIGIYEITFDEYDRFCRATGQELPDDGGWGRGRRPVINVSWDHAVAYSDWLSAQTGARYRLASDAEWEFAARAGSTSRFWWGDEPGSGNANCDGCGSLWGGEKSSPVGRFRANAYGLHDTAGNVFEWVGDCWSDRFDAAPDDGSALLKPGCGVRVIRGGAWSFPPKEVRSANRWRDFQARRSDDTGFRLVRVLNAE
ncbi:MAG: formylglycine-generating enzyme family protein [Gammaproteobacteria bacterium]|nr:formylglycine-generating enzyme family protein [Gammaproteobacteria bacterium]